MYWQCSVYYYWSLCSTFCICIVSCYLLLSDPFKENRKEENGQNEKVSGCLVHCSMMCSSASCLTASSAIFMLTKH